MATPPVITSLSPASGTMGGSAFTLTVNGTGFTSDAVVQFGSTPLATNFVSATQLTADVPEDLLASSAATPVRVTEQNGGSGQISFVVPNPIDLCTLEEVRWYVGSNDPTHGGDDPMLQSMITGVSQYWLTRTSRGSLNSIEQYTERYDGTGLATLMLREFPVQSILSLSIDGRPVPASADYIQSGYVINSTQDGILLVGGRNWFGRGPLNVAVTYTAGYEGVPYDVSEAARQQVGVNFKRKSTIDTGSTNYSTTGGATTYRAWEIPPEVERVIQNYRRMFP